MSGTGHAQANGDYDVQSDAWNGLSDVADIARLESVLRTPERLDVGELAPNDALLIVYPTRDLPVASLANFMKAGGRLALADDYGRGEDLLGLYQIGRGEPDVSAVPHLRGNPSLPVVPRAHGHALGAGVSALVTNHPAALDHPELEPIFGWGHSEGASSGKALILAGAVGDGRLVAIGDPSVLINNMLGFRDNRRFAENLLRYLSAGNGGRVFILTGDARIVGRYGEPGADRPLHALHRWLEGIAAARTPPTALLLGASMLAAILLVVAVTSLPRRSPYEGSSMFARASLAGGFVGRVGFFLRSPANLLQPTLVYKFELEGEIVRRLGLSGQTLLRDVLSELRSRGMNEQEIQRARSLLLTLDELRDKQDHPPGPPRVGKARFREIVLEGEQLLRALEETAVHEQKAPRQ